MAEREVVNMPQTRGDRPKFFNVSDIVLQKYWRQSLRLRRMEEKVKEEKEGELWAETWKQMDEVWREFENGYDVVEAADLQRKKEFREELCKEPFNFESFELPEDLYSVIEGVYGYWHKITPEKLNGLPEEIQEFAQDSITKNMRVLYGVIKKLDEDKIKRMCEIYNKKCKESRADWHKQTVKRFDSSMKTQQIRDEVIRKIFSQEFDREVRKEAKKRIEAEDRKAAAARASKQRQVARRAAVPKAGTGGARERTRASIGGEGTSPKGFPKGGLFQSPLARMQSLRARPKGGK